MKGKKNRTRYDIASEILYLTNGKDSAGKTKIMYKTVISWSMVNDYVDLLTQNGLLEETTRNESTVYITTNRGKEALRKMEILGRLLSKSS